MDFKYQLKLVTSVLKMGVKVKMHKDQSGMETSSDICDCISHYIRISLLYDYLSVPSW